MMQGLLRPAQYAKASRARPNERRTRVKGGSFEPLLLARKLSIEHWPVGQFLR
jgi:hypothetical protein